jgi:amino acid permease
MPLYDQSRGQSKFANSLVLPSHHRMRQTVSSQTQQTSADLPRVLGASQAMAIVVGTIIGSGIFLGVCRA